MYHLADFGKGGSKKKNNSLRNKLLAGTAVAALGGAGLLVALKSKGGGKKVIGVGSKPTADVVEEVAKTKPIVPLPKEVAPVTVKPNLSTRARNSLAMGALQKKTVGVKGFQYIANGKVVRVKGFNRQQLKKVLQQAATKLEAKVTPSQIDEIVIGLNGNTAKRKAVGIQRVNLSSKQLNKLAANRKKASKSISNKVRNADTKGVISRNLASTNKEDIPQVIIQSSARVKQGTSSPKVIGLLPAAGQTSSPVNLSVDDFLVGLNSKTNKVNNNTIASQLPLITPKLTPQQNRLITASLNNRNPVVTGQYSARNIQGRLIASGRSRKEVAKLIKQKTKGSSGRLVKKNLFGYRITKPSLLKRKAVRDALNRSNKPLDWRSLDDNALKIIGARHNTTKKTADSFLLSTELHVDSRKTLNEVLTNLDKKVFKGKVDFPVLEITARENKNQLGAITLENLSSYNFLDKQGKNVALVFEENTVGIKSFNINKDLFKEFNKKVSLVPSKKTRLPELAERKLQGVFLHEFSHELDLLLGAVPNGGGYRSASSIPGHWANELVQKVRNSNKLAGLTPTQQKLIRADNDHELFAQTMAQYLAEKGQLKKAQKFLSLRPDNLYFKDAHKTEWEDIKKFIEENFA